MYNPGSDLKDEMHKILRVYMMQTDHLISTRNLYVIIINKKENLPSCGFCRLSGPLSEDQKKR